MGAKKNKNIWIFGIKEQVYAVNNTGKKKDTIIKKMKICRYAERFRYAEKDSYQCCIEENAWTNVDGLLKGDTFWRFYFEKGGALYDIEGGDNFWEKNNIKTTYNAHLYIPVEQEKHSNKNRMDKRRENKHEKIIPSRLELQG